MDETEVFEVLGEEESLRDPIAAPYESMATVGSSDDGGGGGSRDVVGDQTEFMLYCCCAERFV